MRTLKLVSIHDFDGILVRTAASNEELRFRLEIFEGLSKKSQRYFGRLLRWDHYRLVPSFPQVEGRPSASAADVEFPVLDDSGSARDFSGQTVDQVLQKAQSFIRETFGLSRERKR